MKKFSFAMALALAAMGCTSQKPKFDTKEVLGNYNLLLEENANSAASLQDLVAHYERLGVNIGQAQKEAIFGITAKDLTVALGTFMSLEKPILMDCSDDPADMFASYAKQVEKLALDQFPISLEEEEEYGDMAHEQGVSQQYTLIDTDPRHKTISKIFKKMLPFATKGIAYDIHLIKDDEMVNAFAILGGHLYFTTGLLKFVESEDELAVIIGHELGHVEKGHCVSKIQKLKVASQMMGDDIGGLLINIEMQLSAPFGQIDEYESDRMGAYFAHKTGYDPRRGKDFFARLEKGENYDIIGKLTRTHPYSAQRKQCLEYYITNELKR